MLLVTKDTCLLTIKRIVPCLCDLNPDPSNDSINKETPSRLCDSTLDPNIDSTNQEMAICPLELKTESLGTAILWVFGPKSGTNLTLEKSLILNNETLTTCGPCLYIDPPNLEIKCPKLDSFSIDYQHPANEVMQNIVKGQHLTLWPSGLQDNDKSPKTRMKTKILIPNSVNNTPLPADATEDSQA
ncbi:hypothetical protein DSO57_1025590 [Entomophthora muscae]|uniref:Uncharacterized protein n=1 Tax=Entomophthora muscae TaxID=34485 RepID=A0ACC2U1A5_9FUNG|nr:hypothetical protein DSO57_1025590 [Entomophthora muscae]